MTESQADRESLRAEAHRALRAGNLKSAFASFAGVLGQGPETTEKRVLFANAYISENRPDQVALMYAAALLAEGDIDAAAMLYQLVRREQARDCEFFVTTPQDDPSSYCAGRGYPVAFQPRYDLIKMSMYPKTETTARSFVCGLPGGRVLGQSFIPLAADGAVFPNRMIFNPIRAFRYDAADSVDCLAVPAENRFLAYAKRTANYGPALLMGATPNAGHWIFNHVMRIVMARSDPALKDLPVVLGASPTQLHLQTLARLGIGPERIIRLGHGELATFEMLWLPSQLISVLGRKSTIHWSPQGMKDTRSALGVADRPPGQRRLFLTRRNAKWRRLVNEELVFQRLQPLGFELVEVGDWTLDEQIAAAADTEIIVGTFGAAMSLTFLAPTQTRVVELCFPGMRMMTHGSITHGIGQPYFRVYGQSLGGGQDVTENDLTVDPDLVFNTVVKALLRPGTASS